jgi:hypothetical protein
MCYDSASKLCTICVIPHYPVANSIYQNIFARKNQGSIKAISKQASMKLQNGCRLQQVLSLSTVVVVFAIVRPCQSSMNLFTSNPVTFLASEPQISQRLCSITISQS